jgi:tricorn protease
MPARVPALALCCLLLFTSGATVRTAAADTRLLAQPAVSATHVAFVYAGDLWSATLAGGDIRRLTTSQGDITNPAFSPDGRTIAFSADYDGNIDVYVVPVDGGAPTRLTWHPGPDLVQGFVPDGRSVLFTSPRSVFTSRFTRLFTVPIAGGVESELPIPNASRGAYSPDAKYVAYNPLSAAFAEWKAYRGGRVSTISVFDVQSHAVEKVPQPESRANDADPMWLGSTVYFRSDRDGEFNLYSYDRGTKRVQQLTRHADFPVLNASAGGGHIVYEQAGYLHLFDPGDGSSKKLTFSVPSDLRETRERYVRGSKWIRSATLSPSGARAAFDFRGDIVTVPAEKGDVRNLTLTAGVHEHSPVWSPDGTRIAYFSDAGGEYRLVVAPQDGKGSPKTYPVEGHGYYEDPVWSPDSQRLSYTDNSQSVYWIDLPSGRARKVASQQTYTPASQVRHTWSPDSKWLVPGDRRPRRGDRAGVRPERQVLVFLRIDGRRTDPRLVLAGELRHARDAQHLHGRAAQGSAVAAGERERRGRQAETADAGTERQDAGHGTGHHREAGLTNRRPRRRRGHRREAGGRYDSVPHRPG